MSVRKLVAKSKHVVRELEMSTFTDIFNRMQVEVENLSYTKLYSVLKSLKDKKQIDFIALEFGYAYRHIYFEEGKRQSVEKKIQQIKDKIFTILDKKEIAATPTITRQVSEEFKVTRTVAYCILKNMASLSEIVQRSFITTKGKTASLYFLPKKLEAFNETISSVREFIRKEKFASLGQISTTFKLSLEFANFVLKHLVFREELEVAPVRFYSLRYRGPVFMSVYCIPGFTEEAKEQMMLRDWKGFFENLARKLSVDKEVVKKSLEILNRLKEKEFTRGREYEVIACSSFYLASKIYKCPVIPEELANQVKRGQSEIMNTAKDAARILKMPASLLLVKPQDYVETILGKLDLLENEKARLKKETSTILEAIPRRFVFGKSRNGIACAAIYLAAKRLGLVPAPITESLLGEKGKTTEVTIRNLYKDMTKFIE